MKNLFPLLFLLLGCSPSATRILSPAVVDAVDASVKTVAAVYEAEQHACIGTPAETDCINKVRDRWAIARASLLATQAAIRAASGAK